MTKPHGVPHLCLGGPCDGQWKTILEGHVLRVYIPHHVPVVELHDKMNAPINLEWADYHLFEFETGVATSEFVFVWHHVASLHDAFQMLLKGYKKP